MGKGVFLKENRSREQSGVSQREDSGRSAEKAKRLRKQKHRHRFLGYGFLAGLMIFLVAIVFVLAGNPLIGRWNIDEVTSYEFSRNGEGTMILPAAQYGFTYSIDGDILNIDFEYEGAKDAQYKFTVEGDVLTLDGGNSNTQGTFELTRSK